MTHQGRFRRFRFVFACLVSLAPVLAGACGGSGAKSDTPLPCTSGAWLHIVLDPSVATMAQPKITACRNDACYDWAPAPLPSARADGAWGTFPDAVWITGYFWHNADGSNTLDIQWTIIDESQLQDGDHYVVKLANGTGVATTLLDQTATYVRSSPGVADSGPTCMQATLTS